MRPSDVYPDNGDRGSLRYILLYVHTYTTNIREGFNSPHLFPMCTFPNFLNFYYYTVNKLMYGVTLVLSSFPSSQVTVL
jgi:hypothetical protein